jgi:hypothetical protein
MDIFAPAGSQASHKLELYTEHLLIAGSVTSAFKRISDLLNKGDSEFLKVDEALITPLGKPPAQKPVEGAVMVSLDHLHFVVEALQKKPASGATGGPADDLEVRSAYVRKDHYPCFALTGTYAIHGYCYLHPGTTLDSLLHGHDIFMPITKATIYLVSDAKSTWSRDLVVINRKMISAMYLTA